MSIIQQEAFEYYGKAVKLGHKAQKEYAARGANTAPEVLDEILDLDLAVSQVDLGIIEIPSELIVGTKSKGRISAFSPNFLPLLPDGTEFSQKWVNLCIAHLGDSGIRDPIQCYEYMGKFYVEEGNKRVSVLRYFNAPTIPGHVTRIIPPYSEDEKVQRYYDFLKNYQQTKLYSMIFTQAGGFARLQAALGFDTDYVWTDDDRRYFNSRFVNFQMAYQKRGGDDLSITPMDALLVWLKVYPFEKLREFNTADLNKSLQAVWPDINVLSHDEPIAVDTEAQPEGAKSSKGLWDKIVSSVLPSTLNIAFIHELSEDVSTWTQAHIRGSHQMKEALGDTVVIQEYTGVGNEDDAEAAMVDAIKNGAQVIFATTVSLIGICRKVAAQFPNVKILNCSISMPYTGVRTYYSRIFEGKFISGAIAGALTKSNRIGYIASYPIFGVPAGINAFAMGVQLTNPEARIELNWSCVPGDHISEMQEMGIDIISTLDIPVPGWTKGDFGAFQLLPDGSTRMLSSPYWNWGTFYIKLVQSIMNGSWDTLNNNKNDQAVNYWWGIASGVVGIELSPDIPEGVRTLANILHQGIATGTVSPFHRHIVSQDGTVQNDGTKYFDPEELLHMQWLCDNVDGQLPDFATLTPKGQSIVRLQGVYRDALPPEKEGMLL